MKKEDTGKYEAYELNDFICDEYFQRWALRPTPENDAFWQKWMQEHPDKQDDLLQAKAMLSNLRFQEHWPAEARVTASLERALDDIGAATSPYGAVADIAPERKSRRLFLRMTVAASFTGILVLTSILFYRSRHPKPVSYATAFGNTHTILLPDSSLVILNAHSSLAYTPWKSNSPREVWLDGEAFFNVRNNKVQNDKSHTGTPGTAGQATCQAFVVRTKDLVVEVLATAFDIRQRRGKTEIVLQSGKIRVTFINGGRPPVILLPGDLLSYDPQAQSLSRTTTVASDYTGWTSGKLLLPDPDVRQIAQYLEDNFGYKVVLKDAALAQKRVEGPILFDNLDDVLFVLSRVLNVDITKQDSTLTLIPR